MGGQAVTEPTDCLCQPVWSAGQPDAHMNQELHFKHRKINGNLFDWRIKSVFIDTHISIFYKCSKQIVWTHHHHLVEPLI